MNTAAGTVNAGAEAFRWWNGRRVAYALVLAGAGVVAFVLYVFEFELFGPRHEESEITLFTVGFQAFGYMMFMAAAHVAYTAGPLVEALIKPRSPELLRRILFWGGAAFSALIPFAVPLIFYLEFGFRR